MSFKALRLVLGNRLHRFDVNLYVKMVIDIPFSGIQPFADAVSSSKIRNNEIWRKNCYNAEDLSELMAADVCFVLSVFMCSSLSSSVFPSLLP